jgi:hypothetical protein
MCLQDTVRIPLWGRGNVIRAYALVDATDAAWANQWRWNLSHYGYAVRHMWDGKRRVFYMHRELLSLVAGDKLEGDHINRNTLDCRRSNLRVVPQKGRPNNQNQRVRRDSKSLYRGVGWHKQRGQWRARVRINGKEIHLGLFASEQAAAEAARAARKRLMPYATD